MYECSMTCMRLPAKHQALPFTRVIVLPLSTTSLIYHQTTYFYFHSYDEWLQVVYFFSKRVRKL